MGSCKCYYFSLSVLQNIRIHFTIVLLFSVAFCEINDDNDDDNDDDDMMMMMLIMMTFATQQ